MTAQSSISPVSAGATVAPINGALIGTGDTYPAGCLLLAINGGAGTHVITVAVNYSPDGLPVTSRAISIGAGVAMAIRVPALYGDANGRVIVSVDGTPSEVKFYPLAA